MYVLEASEHLVQEELVVLRREVVVGLDDLSGARERHDRLRVSATLRVHMLPLAKALQLACSSNFAPKRIASSAHLVEVGLQQLEDDVDVLEVLRAGRQHDVLDVHNVCTSSSAQERILKEHVHRRTEQSGHEGMVQRAQDE